MTTVTVIGDAVVDVDVTGQVDRVGPEGCVVLEADAERRRPGAAALAATFAAADRAEVRLVTALGTDEAAHWLRRALAAAGVIVIDLGLDGPTPQKWRLRSADGTLLRVDRDCSSAAVVGSPGSAAWEAVRGADAVLVSDYGRGVMGAARSLVRATVAGRPVTWDPHPRGPRPCRGLDLVTPNEREALSLGPRHGTPSGPRELAQHLMSRLHAAVVLTCGKRGAVLAEPDEPVVEIPTTSVHGDTCGAGDRLAARATVERARGASRRDAVEAGVAAATRYVATGDASTEVDGGGDPFELAAHVRRRGGTVVATGGCFDLLHAGHVQLLTAARSLGDCLIVCLNSDRSVRRLKGPGRPVVNQDDRRRVLEALESVDAVAIFDEDTPATVLERLRPDVFAKGADYAPHELAERAVLKRWGGRIAILPLSDGRSTSRLIELVRTEAS
jgi:D-beta-D-heptose 7-phosphate kinase/D-beta-D-heptose 1-phosphate adenosyltransferase